MALFTRVEFERIQRGAALFLKKNLNNQISAEASEWAAYDSQFSSDWGTSVPTVGVESVQSENFYWGVQPSLLDAPVERYPNISAFTYRADAQASNDDHMDKFLVNLAIEIMCKAVTNSDRFDVDENVAACTIVGSRLDRTISAAHNVMMSDAARSFGKVVPLVGNMPNIIKTDIFVRRQEKGRGPRWVWQGARFDYRVETWVQYPG